jgi:hypothetical protein
VNFVLVVFFSIEQFHNSIGLFRKWLKKGFVSLLPFYAFFGLILEVRSALGPKGGKRVGFPVAEELGFFHNILSCPREPMCHLER